MKKSMAMVAVMVLGMSVSAVNAEVKYAFPQSDQPVKEQKGVNSPQNAEKYGIGEVLANGQWVSNKDHQK